MRKTLYFLSLLAAIQVTAQETPREPGHTDNNKFSQMYSQMATPNMFRTASGAPGPAYYQQQADYKIDIELDDENTKLYGNETITYHNNAPEALDYLWVQLDQNRKAPDSKSPLANSQGVGTAYSTQNFSRTYLEESFDGGFKIEYVKDANGKPMSYIINQTMMRIDLPAPLQSGEKISFSIKWWYNINNYFVVGGRSGYERFEEENNNLYVIAQFYPRMAVYNDVEGWQNMQFWGGGEFALPFGNFDVNITVPADHIMEATGLLTNREEVFTAAQLKRYEQATKSFDKPVVVVTQEEAIEAEKTHSTKKKTWKFKAENVRDFGFSTSRKFIYDAMAVQLSGKTAMAISIYPKESNPLWGENSTRVVAHTLKTYSKYTFDYPYPKAVSVSAESQGMEYPMICWNYGRPDKDGFTSEQLKYGMMSVIIHEVGHNFFPMIVNSDERQWTWMDEGLNTFLQYLTEQEFQKNYPSRRGPAAKIVPYMSGDQNFLEPIMTNSEAIHQFGSNAYAKPATGLNILRETIMGEELFDYAFKTYANRWKFKHPTPEDFFRTMEDASAVDLDWFWRGWFYSTDYVDIGIADVKQYYVSDKKPNSDKKKTGKRSRFDRSNADTKYVYMIPEGDDVSKKLKKPFTVENVKDLEEYVEEKFTPAERARLKSPKYFYEVTFNKPGGMFMPILVELQFEDGTTESYHFPAQIWRKNNQTASRVFATEKPIKKITVDPELKTADIDINNNVWPAQAVQSKFDQFGDN
ncbi:M1 family peptidase [Flavobacterium arcticum]|uniref:M1 family peptidase n=1 Tax=Flavobacterium arcticum TaxID=1784713 RepID=A0A345HF98_9FLAO|nr:M1 family metallopeptidase [Flavobacterium arcticum]AXG75258.1 M1 family peptidase [Flavobacterium arcticum]KAF2508259.1 M1 family metallopeptidase [Flavobacterium arcticum]